jgi:hypothetical protein
MKSVVLFLAAAVLAVVAPAADLTFSRVALPGTVVYELPGLPADQAQRITESIRSNFHDSLVLDAAALDDVALKTKLGGPFVLLTFLHQDSKLLARLAAPVPLKWSGGNVSWADFSAPANDLTIAFVLKNPFGAGNAIVTAYGSLTAMRSHSLPPDASYAIFRGTERIRIGVYDEDYRPVVCERLTLSAATADAHELFATLRRVHPANWEDRYVHMEPEAVAAIEHDAHDGNLCIEQLAWTLSYSLGQLHDGHTWLEWRHELNEPAAVGRRFPPFRLRSLNGRFYIAQATDHALVDQELIAVNGKPAAEFLRPLLERGGAETALFRALRLTYSQDFLWWTSNLFGRAESCCTLKLSNGDHTVRPISFSEYAALRPSGEPRPNTHLEMLAGGKVARLAYPAFQVSDSEKRAIDDAFHTILESTPKDLIIDIRGNGGGNSSMGDQIFSYLRDNIEQGMTRARVSRELFADWSKDMKLPPGAEMMVAPLMGKIVSSEDPIAKAFESMQPKPPVRTQRYSGRLWLLVDNGTFSAACMFTGAFRDYSMGKIVGYETGEPPIAYGNFLQFHLKNSNIPYVVSAIQFFPPKPRTGDDAHGIIPDFPVNEKLLAPFARESDPMLAYTLSLIRDTAR